MNQIIGHYELLSEIGRGGMGVVYRARHTLMDEIFALKLIHPEHAQNQEFRRRFLAEAKTLYKLKHPGIVDFRDIGESDGRLFLVTELLAGETLDVRLLRKPGPQAPASVRHLLTQAAAALALGHRLGVVHRDIKPGNLFLHQSGHDSEERLKLLDYGLARDSEEATMTATGLAVGTPAYLPPEVMKGQRADFRADIYALGVIGFELLCGRKPVPISGEASSVWSKMALLFEAFQKGLPRVRELRPDAPEGLASLIDACLTLDPEGRPADGTALCERLNEVTLAPPSVGVSSPKPSPDLDTTLIGISLARPAKRDETPPPAAPVRDDPDCSLLGIGLRKEPVAEHAKAQAANETPSAAPVLPKRGASDPTLGGGTRPLQVAPTFLRRHLWKIIIAWLALSLLAAILIALIAQSTGDRADRYDCKEAVDEASFSVWGNYLEKHPDGVCAEDARRFRLALREKALAITKARQEEEEAQEAEMDRAYCVKARDKKTTVGWKAYLSVHPAGICKEEADRFIRMTWLDSKTGLEWQVNPTEKTMNWNKAKAYCRDLRVGDYQSWQLPSKSELASLVRRNASGCKWPGEMKGKCGWYWSSSTYDTDSAWGFDFESGDKNPYNYPYPHLVRCVFKHPTIKYGL